MCEHLEYKVTYKMTIRKQNIRIRLKREDNIIVQQK